MRLVPVAILLLFLISCNYAFIPKDDLLEFRYCYLVMEKEIKFETTDAKNLYYWLAKTLDNWCKPWLEEKKDE